MPLASRAPRRLSHPRRLLLLGGAAPALLAASVATASVSPLGGFGHGGTATLGGGRINAVAAERDGGVVAVGSSGGSMLVERLRPNGSRRTTFRAGSGIADAVLVQPNGKVVVAGVSASTRALPLGQMVIERFNPSGSLDRRFGHGGVTRIGNGTIANAVALGPHGTIVVAGSVPGPDATPRVAIAELGAGGAPVRSFGHGGLSEINLGPFSSALAVAVQRDGRIVFAGEQSPNLQQVNGLVGRVTSHGGLDHSFGHGGVTTYLHPHGGGASSLDAIALASGGRIVAAGADAQSTGQHALFVRLTSHGGYDGGFGSGGTLTTPSAQQLSGSASVGVRGLAITRGGEILGAGGYITGAQTSGAVWALTSGGHLDGRQGSGGRILVPLSGALGGELRSAALGSGRLFAGGDTLGLGGSVSSAVVVALRLSGIR